MPGLLYVVTIHRYIHVSVRIDPPPPYKCRVRQVEALTLQREDGRYETACNLLRPKETTPAMVLEVAKEQADVLGVKVVKDYETGLSEEEALKAISLLVR